MFQGDFQGMEADRPAPMSARSENGSVTRLDLGVHPASTPPCALWPLGMHPMAVEQFAQARRHVESGRRAVERQPKGPGPALG